MKIAGLALGDPCKMIPENFSGLVLFTASWAASSCQSSRQILETALTRTTPPLPLLEIEESDASESVFDAYEIEAVPCLMRMWEGREVGRVIGAESKDILRLLSMTEAETKSERVKNIGDSGDSASAASAATLNSTAPVDYKALVSQSPLMLFIKGTASEPRCGFTTQLIRLLTDHGLTANIHYTTFNILSDDSIRAGLKEWAQWPTYPQIYWQGELLGGLDILREMFAAGQMESIISELKSVKK